MTDDKDKPQTQAEYRAVADSVELPSWMDHPEADLPVYPIVEGDGVFLAVGYDGSFESIEQAYDFISENLNGTPDLSAVEGDGLLVTPEGRGLISFTPDDRLRLQRYTYWEFRQLHAQYTADPDDFYTAYHWLASHPAFYYRTEDHLNRWEQEDGLREVTTTVVKDDDGNVRVLLETGMNTNERRIGTERYADYRLAAWGSSMEDAYVNLASAVNEHVTPEGIDRGQDGTRPPWLERVIESLGADES